MPWSVETSQLPRPVGAEREDAGVTIDFRPVEPGRLGEGVRRTRRIEMALHGLVDRSEHAARVHDGAEIADLGRTHEPRIEAQGLVARDIRAQQIPSLLRGRHIQPARIVQANVLPRDLLQLRVERDRIGLQARHRRIAVQRMERARRVPARSGGQFPAFAKRHIAPAELRQMVEHAAADDAAADDQHLHMGLHRVGFAAIAFRELCNETSASSKRPRPPEASVRASSGGAQAQGRAFLSRT